MITIYLHGQRSQRQLQEKNETKKKKGPTSWLNQIILSSDKKKMQIEETVKELASKRKEERKMMQKLSSTKKRIFLDTRQNKNHQLDDGKKQQRIMHCLLR